MAHVPVRAHTHQETPPAWTRSNLDYRTFNERFYEPWLKRAYASTVRPFYLEPEHVYVKYLSEFGTSIRRQHLDMIRGAMDHDFVAFFDNEDLRVFLLNRWHDATVRQREDWTLQVYEFLHHRAETAKFQYRRHDCPELTVDWAEDPFNFQLLIMALRFDPKQEPHYRSVPNKDWSRLNDCSNAATPPSRGRRAFTDEGKLTRVLFMIQFTISLCKAILGIPEPVRELYDSGVAPTAEDDAQVAMSQPSPSTGLAIVMNKRGGTKHCASCLKTETEKGVHLTWCGRCKERVRREVWYCGAECQHAHWPSHKLECGKTLVEAEAAFLARAPLRRPPTFAQLNNIKWLAQYPRAVWGTEFQVEDRPGKYGEKESILFELPTYVSPFLETLQALIELRDRALKEKDDIDVGLLAYFVRLIADQSARGTVLLSDDDQYLELLATLLEIDAKELSRLLVNSLERLKSAVSGDDDLDERIMSAFTQLMQRSGDPSDTTQNLLPSALPLLDDLLSHPDIFYSFSLPATSPSLSSDSERFTIPVRKSLPDYDRALPALRALALRTVMTGGRDARALGRLMLLVFAASGLNGRLLDSSVEGAGTEDERAAKAVMRGCMVAELEAMLELEEGAVDEAVGEAERELADETDGEEQEKEERALSREVLRYLRETTRAELSEGATPAEDAPAPLARAAKKKKNKKKKKKRK
ncbi:hypothetical protein JCM8097_006213 [Rhodosporidiobolus ruineniae]